MSERQPAALVLEDGGVFWGERPHPLTPSPSFPGGKDGEGGPEYLRPPMAKLENVL